MTKFNETNPQTIERMMYFILIWFTMSSKLTIILFIKTDKQILPNILSNYVLSNKMIYKVNTFADKVLKCCLLQRVLFKKPHRI